MADGHYRGRRGSDNVILTHSEVALLYERRERLRRDFRPVLDAAVRREPFGAPERGHLYLVAQAARLDFQALIKAIGQADPHEWIRDNLLQAPYGASTPLRPEWWPDIPRNAVRFDRRHDGFALHSDGLNGAGLPTGTAGDLEEGILDLELHEWEHPARTVGRTEPRTRVQVPSRLRG